MENARNELRDPIDNLLVSAIEQEDKRYDFYQALLETELVVIGTVSQESSGSEELNVTLKYIEIENEQVLPVFTNGEKFNTLLGTSYRYIKIPCKMLLEAADLQHPWVINPGFGPSKKLITEELETLRDRRILHHYFEQLSEIRKQELLTEPFVELTDQQQEALSASIQPFSPIQKAYLVNLYHPSEKPFVLLAFEANIEDREKASSLVDAVKEALHQNLQAEAYECMLLDDSHELSASIIRQIQPFYIRDKLYLSQIQVMIDQTQSENKRLAKKQSQISEVENRISSMRHQVDGSITARRGIDRRFQQVGLNVSELEKRVQSMYNFIEYAMESYLNAEKQIKALKESQFGVEHKKTFWGQVSGGFGKAIDVVDAFGMGLTDAVVGTVEGLYTMVAHPVETFKGIAFVVQHPVLAGTAMWQAVEDSWKTEVANGDAESRSRWFGRAIGEVALSVVGTKGVDKAAKALKVGKVIEETGGVRIAAKSGSESNVARTLNGEIKNPASVTDKGASEPPAVGGYSKSGSGGIGDSLGSAYDHVYTSTRPIEEVFPELKGVNPHYQEGAGPGVNTNCVSCANATHARITGRDPFAAAEPSSGYGNKNGLLPSAPFGFHEQELLVSDVVKIMTKAGDGSASVVILEQGSIQHVINVINKGGEIYFVDSQIGKIVDLNPNLILDVGRP